jgi:peptidoglycan/LPS O-acetylase OafA/YrhL
MKVDLILTFLLMALLFAAIMWKSTPKDGPFSFDKNFTGVLKGVSAIIVVFVHVPELYHNAVQRMVMSFGFVAVTVFFMISAYGMQFSANRSGEKYLSHFWRNRLASLLIPCLLVNLFCVLFNVCTGRDFSPLKALVNMPGYVWVLLQYCILFFVVMFCQLKLKIKPSICYVIMVAAVVGSSLFLYLSSPDANNSAEMGWCYERMGLVWGLLLFLFFAKIADFMNSRWFAKTLTLGFFSLVLGVAYLMTKTVWFYGEYLLKIVLGLVIVAFVLFLSRKRSLGNAVVNHLGAVSYEIYLSHELMMRVIAYLLPSVSSGVFLVLTMTATIAFSTVVHMVSSRLVSRVRV